MTRYSGPIKSKAAADRIAARLDEVGTGAARGAAALLRRNWQSVAARPVMAAQIVALSECEPLSAGRPGSVMHRLTH